MKSVIACLVVVVRQRASISVIVPLLCSEILETDRSRVSSLFPCAVSVERNVRDSWGHNESTVRRRIHCGGLERVPVLG
jgi:Ni,Fe-hydrogenase III component G